MFGTAFLHRAFSLIEIDYESNKCIFHSILKQISAYGENRVGRAIESLCTRVLVLGWRLQIDYKLKLSNQEDFSKERTRKPRFEGVRNGDT